MNIDTAKMTDAQRRPYQTQMGTVRGTLMADLYYCTMPARLAIDIAKVMAGTAQMANAMSEDSAITPAKLASFACDVAQQLINQMGEREWLALTAPPEYIDPPQPQPKKRWAWEG